MRIALLLAVLFQLPNVLLANDPPPFADWIFPGASLKEQVSSPVTVTSADKKHVQELTTGLGQYVTDKPFHEVLAYYVRKSGLTPPNWSILGRKFPGTDIHIPAHFSETNLYREKPSVTLLHFIRERVATAHLLVTDHPDFGFISVSITRGENDDQTLIQLIQHPSKRIEKAIEQSPPPEPATKPDSNGNSSPPAP